MNSHGRLDRHHREDARRRTFDAVGSRYGAILPAKGHLFDLLEPEEVEPAWKRWSPVLLRPDGLYGIQPARGGNKTSKLKASRRLLTQSRCVGRCRRIYRASAW